MSYAETNGHATPLTELREQLESARARHEMARLRQETLLLEAYLPHHAGPGELIDPAERWRDPLTGELWVPSSGGRSSGAPEQWTEQWLDDVRRRARDMSTFNPAAKGVLRALRNFTIRKGFSYQAVPEKDADDPRADELAEMVQADLDDFLDSNDWPAREKETLTRAVRDGEVFVRHFPRSDGREVVRFVDPELIRQPQDHADAPAWSWGILTHPEDVETPLAYAIHEDEGPNYDEVDAVEIRHLKRNVDRCVKRGLSDFAGVEGPFEDVRKLLRNMAVGGAVRAAVAWVEQFDMGTAGGISALAASNRDQHRPNTKDPVTGREPNFERFDPGTIVRTGAGRTYVPPPGDNNTTNHVATAQAVMRFAGTAWNMPEFLISGDASNNNFASALVAGGPFTIAIEEEQGTFADFFLAVIWRHLKRRADSGRYLVGGERYDYARLKRVLDVSVEPPEVAIANRAEEASIDSQDIQAGVVSKRTVRQKRGYDPDEEARQIAEEKAAEGEAPSPFEGKDPCEAERLLEALDESADLGDVADILAHVLGEDEALALLTGGEVAESLFPLLEGFTGERKDKAGRRICYQDGKRVPCEKKEKPKKEKPTLDGARERIKGLGDNPKPRQAFELAQHLAGLTNKDLGSLKKELGVRGGGRRKEELVNALRDRLFPEGEGEAPAKAEAPAKKKPAAKEKPAPKEKPSAGEEPAREAPAEAVPPTDPKEFGRDVLGLAGGIKRGLGQKVLLGDIRAQAKKKWPGMDDAAFDKMLGAANQAGTLTLTAVDLPETFRGPGAKEAIDASQYKLPGMTRPLTYAVRAPGPERDPTAAGPGG